MGSVHYFAKAVIAVRIIISCRDRISIIIALLQQCAPHSHDFAIYYGGYIGLKIQNGVELRSVRNLYGKTQCNFPHAEIFLTAIKSLLKFIFDLTFKDPRYNG